MTTREAEKQIGQILKQLESDAGSTVRSIAIVDIETTDCDDTSRQMKAHVVIEMERIPVRGW